MSILSDTLQMYYTQGQKTKITPSGWMSRNAPCCHHNGTGADTRMRGGLITSDDVVSYSCFNCGYKASWQPGRPVSYKMRKLLEWLGTPDDVINKLALDVMRINEGIEVTQQKILLPEFTTVELPEGSIRLKDIKEFTEPVLAILEYMAARNLDLDDTDYYWSAKLGYRDRLIIPFYYEGRIVGWTSRTIIADKNPKYLTESQPGFVYGLSDQTHNKAFALLVEGQIDAIHIEGCALGGSEISDQQALMLNRLAKDIYVVPDRDWNGKKLTEDAIDRSWGVSLPDWSQDVKDVGDAVAKYGRLYTLYSIVLAAETSPLKIRLRAKKWFV